MRKLLLAFFAVAGLASCAIDDYDGGHHHRGYDDDDYGYRGYYPYGRADYPRDRIWIVDGRGCRYYSYQGYCYRYKDDYHRAIDWDRKHGYDDNWHKKRKDWCNKHDCRRDHDDRYDDRRGRDDDRYHDRYDDRHDNRHHDRDDVDRRGFAPVRPQEPRHAVPAGGREPKQGHGGWWPRSDEGSSSRPVGRDTGGSQNKHYREHDSDTRRGMEPARERSRDVERQQPSSERTSDRQPKRSHQAPATDSGSGQPTRESKGKHNRQAEDAGTP